MQNAKLRVERVVAIKGILHSQFVTSKESRISQLSLLVTCAPMLRPYVAPLSSVQEPRLQEALPEASQQSAR